MKNKLLLIGIGFAAFLSLTAFSSESFKIKNKIMTFFGYEPHLPETPYNYKISIPAYLTFQSFWMEQNQPYIEGSISNKIATLGRVLFYDKVLSSDNTVACASCHKQAHGFADNQPLSTGVFGQKTNRNAQNMNDLFWRTSYTQFATPLFWDARETNLHQMVIQPIVNPQEMGMVPHYIISKLQSVPYYPGLYEDAFGEPGIDLEKTKTALTQFVRSMVSFDSKYDKVKNGEAVFTESEAKGEIVFNNHCNTCHTAPLFSVLTPILNGFPTTDSGFGNISGVAADSGKFVAPTLRNITLTAPYMHDGSFATLERVLRFYSDSISFPFPVYYGNTGQTINGAFEMTSVEVNDLTAFLHTLTSPNLLTNPKWSDPFVEPLAVHDSGLDMQVRIFPNPFSSSTSIEFDNPTGKTVELNLRSLDGKIVKALTTKAESATIEKGNLSAGIYLLEIKNGDLVLTQRVVLQ
jgi:cytochrome c peroxidase